MPLPTEIIEKILVNCDGKTLLTARSVCKQWLTIVDYISEKTQVWRWCCMEEIPKTEMIQYKNSLNNNDEDVWFYIYKTWVSFQNMEDIAFETILSPAEIPRITCMDVYNDYIAVGSEDGRVRIYNQFWNLLHTVRHQAEKVSKVGFLANQDVIKLVIGYPKDLVIDDLFGDGVNNHFQIEGVVLFSIYKDFICHQRLRGMITIGRLNGGILEEIFFSRVYSPSHISCLNMWNGVCTMLVGNFVRKINYEAKPIPSVPSKGSITFSLPNCTSDNVHQILRDDIIIVLYRPESIGDKEYLEVIMLGNKNRYAKKLFNISEALEATITCICLYGNTMVLGVDTGIVYFYHVPSWQHFSINEYQRKIIIGKHPITNIVVKETKIHRKFYITSSFNIHEVVGFSNRFLNFYN